MIRKYEYMHLKMTDLALPPHTHTHTHINSRTYVFAEGKTDCNYI